MTTQLEKQVTGDENLLALSEIKGYANARDFKIGIETKVLFFINLH
jgi:hypothetical protein